MEPHITRAMNWLDFDGQRDDHIPVGGSTYDYQTLPTGAFIYTASCYLGALRAASAVSDADGAKLYDGRLEQTRQSVMADLWNGTFFRKWKSPTTGKTVEDSFVANQAGDWLARLTGLPRTLAPDILHRAVAQTIARHQKPFYPIPPMQVTPEGKVQTHSCYLPQDEPYLGCEAIYENYHTSDGLDTLHRVYKCEWEMNQCPWAQGLGSPAPSGIGNGADYYMTCPTSWFVLNALGGTSVDLPHGRLFVSPRLATGQTELHIPVYFSRFWGWLDYVPAEHHLSLRVDRVFAPDPATEKMLFHAPAPGSPGNPGNPGSTGAAGEAVPETITITSVAADGDGAPQQLPQPFLVQSGATLDLSPFMNQLNLPKAGEVVNVEIKHVATGRPSQLGNR